jgi:nucleoside-diphosphate-sugar epimerase
MNKVLLTGSTGFIGTKLASAIESKNLSIKVISRNKHPKFETEICDFLTMSFSNNIMKDVDTVFHLAGIAHDSFNQKEDFYSVNVKATERLGKLAAKSGVKKFIFVSSVKSGGSGRDGFFINEKDQGIPEGIYGKTKREAEEKLLQIGLNSDMHVSIIRPALVYGPNVKGNLSLMMKGIKSGWFPPLPKINNSRSMVHVDDVVRAMIFVANTEKAKGEIFNVTDGKAHSSREIYEIMCKILGKSVPKWSVPEILFKSMGLINSEFKYKVDKLFGDDYYSSKKLEKIGFHIERTLEEMNETIF